MLDEDIIIMNSTQQNYIIMSVVKERADRLIHTVKVKES